MEGVQLIDYRVNVLGVEKKCDYNMNMLYGMKKEFKKELQRRLKKFQLD